LKFRQHQKLPFGAGIKPTQTFIIILPNLIHQSKKKRFELKRIASPPSAGWQNSAVLLRRTDRRAKFPFPKPFSFCPPVLRQAGENF
jgi:hypothetical protein